MRISFSFSKGWLGTRRFESRFGTYFVDRKVDDCHTLGVWGYAGRDPDDLQTATRLIDEAGVSFVNTDLPRSFIDLGSVVEHAPASPDESGDTAAEDG